MKASKLQILTPMARPSGDRAKFSPAANRLPKVKVAQGRPSRRKV